MKLPTRDDEGISLVLTLVFVAVFGLVMGSILGFAETGEQTTVQSRTQANIVYAASGAVDGAINAIRSSLTAGNEGGPSCDFDSPSTTGGLDTTQIHVSCTPQSGSGASGTGSTSSNTPTQAILTLPAAGETGIAINSNNTFKAKGDVFTNGNISISPGSTLTLCGSTTTDPTCSTHPGSVKARGTCPLTQIVAATKVCPDTTDPAATDPGYPLPTIVTTARTVPTCPASKVVLFSPGTYTDAAGLTSLTSGGCHGAMYFQPGVYYFNFSNSGSHQWAIGDPSIDVIGGQVQNWDPVAHPLTDTRTKLTALVAAGGAPDCASSDLSPLANSGVEFVFDRDSQLFVNQDDSFVLCPQTSTTGQEISVYGVPASAGQQATLVGTSATTDATTPSFSSPLSNAFAPDASHTTYTQAGSVSGASGSHPAHLNITYPQTISTTATVTSVQADIWHYEQPTGYSGNCAQGGDINGVGLQVQIGSAAADTVPTASSQCTWAEDTVTLGAAALAAVQAQVTSGGNVSLGYAVTETGSSKRIDARVDSIQLIVKYTLPGVQGESGCVTATPYPTTGCPLLSTSGNGSNINIHGTVYAPSAAINVQLPNQVGQFFGRGLVARTAIITPPASNPLPTATFSVPDLGGSVPADRKVLFEAHIGSATGFITLRALVQYVDLGKTSPGSAVKILSWSVVR